MMRVSHVLEHFSTFASKMLLVTSEDSVAMKDALWTAAAGRTTHAPTTTTTTTLIQGVFKQPALGGSGGNPFDSGVNPSGVAGFVIKSGPYRNAANVIKRLHVLFRDGRSTQGNIYLGVVVHQNNTNFRNMFEIGPHDSISKVLVWANRQCVHAMQFHTLSGVVSPMFGIPSNDAPEPTETNFLAPDETIVGLHGRFGGILDCLGFTTAEIKTVAVRDSSAEVPEAADSASSIPPQVAWPREALDDDEADSTSVTHDEATTTN